jgi:hypothetical protein
MCCIPATSLVGGFVNDVMLGVVILGTGCRIV